MAEGQLFIAATQILVRATGLSELNARGLVRRLLKQAGLASDSLTAAQLAAVGKALLEGALRKQGIAEGECKRALALWMDHCGRQEERDKQPRQTVTNTVEEVFARMGLRR